MPVGKMRIGLVFVVIAIATFASEDEPNGKCMDCRHRYCSAEYQQGPQKCNDCLKDHKKKFKDGDKCGHDCYTKAQEWCQHAPTPGHRHSPHRHATHQHAPHGHAPHRHAPHKHAPYPACESWPTFKTAAELAASPWGAYMLDVYGSPPPQDRFPLSIGSWWVLWDDLLRKHNVQLPKSSGQCAPPKCQLSYYEENNAYSPPRTSWIWHPPPYAADGPWTTGENGDGWVEVMHKADPFGDEHYGAWFLYTKGSGVWYKIGKHIAFDEHSDAYAHFGVNGNQDMCRAAAKAGFDSIVFLAHKDHVNYPCDKAGGYPFMNVEIVAVKLVGTYACAFQGEPDEGIIRSGWATKPCHCNNQLANSNCGSLLGALVSPAKRALPLPPIRQTGPTDCSTNHTPARDPAWFASCNETGASCLRVTVTSTNASALASLNIGNSTHINQTTLGFLWCIDHTNGVVYARMNATKQGDQPPYLAAYFEVDDNAHRGRSCRFLTTHWATGDIVHVYEPGLLGCTAEYTPSQLPGPDGVTNATVRVPAQR